MAINHRHSIRMRGYDYASPGAYFVTICTAHRSCLFGDIVDGAMRLSEMGTVAADEWLKTPIIRPEIELDEWVIMPNHVHGIVVIKKGRPRVAPTMGPVPQSIGAIVAGFKSVVTRRINELPGKRGAVWQRNYWERVIRGEREMEHIREYIRQNPSRWAQDALYPG